jgi:uncharacterized membrane protein YsdA (DUF1294 family)/cold shock CspA family protein
MRHQGRLRQWNDDRGFGFVEPNGGGDSAFVHARAFKAGGRRPIDGDLITYRREKDEHGRWRAVDVEFANVHRRVEPAESMGSRATARWVGVGGAYLVGVFGFCASGRWPWAALGLVAALSLIAFVAYWNDKRAAQSGRWRTPESHLHLVALIGGWPGAALAQHVLRHKSSKPAFRTVFVATVILNIAAAIYLMGSDGRALRALIASG